MREYWEDLGVFWVAPRMSVSFLEVPENLEARVRRLSGAWSGELPETSGVRGPATSLSVAASALNVDDVDPSSRVLR